jgi:hypothetical protein
MKNVFENLLVGIFILFLYVGMIVFGIYIGAFYAGLILFGIYIGALIVKHIVFFTCAFLISMICIIGWFFRKL